MELKQPIITGFGENQKTISTIDISEKDFTAKVLLEAEREFLLTGGIFPKGDMEGSRAYLGLIASKIIGCTSSDLEKLPGMEFIKVTNIIKGFFEGLEYQELLEMISEKLGSQSQEKPELP